MSWTITSDVVDLSRAFVVELSRAFVVRLGVFARVVDGAFFAAAVGRPGDFDLDLYRRALVRGAMEYQPSANARAWTK